VGRCGSKNTHPKNKVFERDWTTCSKHVNHFRFDNQQGWEDLNDHLMSTRMLL
jgi:hypothetical protein